MIKAISVETNNSFFNKKQNVSFGSLVLSRVVQRMVADNGDIYYSTLMNRDVVGVYLSLIDKIKKAKSSDMPLIQKLLDAISDLKIKKNNQVFSTSVGTNSDCKNFLLIGKEARLKIDAKRNSYIDRVFSKKLYVINLEKELNKIGEEKRIFKNGKEIGVELIVEELPSKEYKIVDIEITTADKLNEHKPSIIMPKKTKVENDGPVQGFFDFPDLPKDIKTHYDYE